MSWSWISPSLLVLVGACLVAGGTFWSAQRQGILNQKIIALQGSSIDLLKGGNNILLMPSAFSADRDGKYVMATFVAGDLPIYDVYITIRSHVDAPMSNDAEQAAAIRYLLHPEHVELGNVPAGIKETAFRLAPGYYQIDVRSRGARLTEMLRFGPKLGSDPDFQMSYMVTDISGKLSDKYTSPNYPSVY